MINKTKDMDVVMQPNSTGPFIGKSSVMLDLYKQIKNVAPTDTPVFIKGASGTGKEVCAREIHEQSDRKSKPFIPLNCAALPHDLIESALFGHVKGAFTGADKNRNGAIAEAEGGTLFLDEICEMPMAIQAKLLRFTQDHLYQKLGSDKYQKADIRIICATNRDPQSRINEGLFRMDLYYRLHVMPIEMPDLYLRNGDILDIAYYYLHHYADLDSKYVSEFSPEVENFFSSYNWPGNIRELQNTVRALVTNTNTKVIGLSQLPSEITKLSNHHSNPTVKEMHQAHLPLWQIEKNAIENTIALCQGNIPKAAAILDVAPSTIYRKKQAWEERNA